MEVYLVRHTAVNNPEKLCYGQSDIALSHDWEKHFDILKQKLWEQTYGAVCYASPYERCARLAAFLSGNKFQTDERLSEMNFGEWEQRPWVNIDQAILNQWMADFVTYKVPGGESFETMHARCSLFWDELLQQPVSKAVIVTHAGVIRSILAYILNMPLNKIFQLEVDFGSITKITVHKQQGCYQVVNYINRF